MDSSFEYLCCNILLPWCIAKQPQCYEVEGHRSTPPNSMINTQTQTHPTTQVAPLEAKKRRTSMTEATGELVSRPVFQFGRPGSLACLSDYLHFTCPTLIPVSRCCVLLRKHHSTLFSSEQNTKHSVIYTQK
jgi:hypothetical protein